MEWALGFVIYFCIGAIIFTLIMKYVERLKKQGKDPGFDFPDELRGPGMILMGLLWPGVLVYATYLTHKLRKSE